MFCKHMLFDLDECIVPRELTLSIPHRVQRYAVKYLGYTPERARRECPALYAEHGTNLEGFMQLGYDIDPDHWHATVHGELDYDRHVHPMPALKTILDSSTATKHIYTNSDLRHTTKCLERTGLDECFKSIACFETLMPMYTGVGTPCKPKRESMRLALQYIEAEPFEVLFFDDNPDNIRMGMEHGVRSVLVGRKGKERCDYYRQIDFIHDVFFLV